MKKRLILLVLAAPFLLAGCTMNGLMGGLVNDPPEAVIDATPTEGDAPLAVAFDAAFSHDDEGIVSYRWDFGDPHDSPPCFDQAVEHTYTYPGTYLVKMTVTDTNGEIDCEKAAILVRDPTPVAKFSVSHDLPPLGEPVLFDASESSDPNGEITSYDWDFGDGNTGTGPITSHTYVEYGDYRAKLTVSDDAGNTGTAGHTIIVQKGNGGGCSGGSCGNDDLPIAVITGAPGCSGVYVGEAVELDGSFSRAWDAQLIRHLWDFGDGETATGERVTHVYTDSGRYTVTLTVTDSHGLQSTARISIRVNAIPTY